MSKSKNTQEEENHSCVLKNRLKKRAKNRNKAQLKLEKRQLAMPMSGISVTLLAYFIKLISR